MDHVIWTGCRILKLLSNYEIGVEFWNVCLLFLFLLDPILIFFITQPFLYFGRCPKIHFTTTLKNTTMKIFQYLTPIPKSNVLSKWHDPGISLDILDILFIFLFSWQNRTFLLTENQRTNELCWEASAVSFNILFIFLSSSKNTQKFKCSRHLAGAWHLLGYLFLNPWNFKWQSNQILIHFLFFKENRRFLVCCRKMFQENSCT